MAEVKTEPTDNASCAGMESNLPDVVASLEMLTVTSASQSSPSTTGKRVLRKRIRKADPPETGNRRCSLRPKKRPANAMDSDEDVKEYYLDRNVRRKPINLETIWEEVEDKADGATLAISSRRFKRLIQFQTTATDAKIRKRRAKIKKVFGTKTSMKRGYTSMQTLINKLNKISSNSPSKHTEDKHKLAKVYECVLSKA